MQKAFSRLTSIRPLSHPVCPVTRYTSINFQRFNGTTTTTAPAEEYSFDFLSLKIGKIKEITSHENADTMYVEQIQTDPAHTQPEELVQVCSGLKNYVPIENLQDSLVVLVNNLKPSKLRGVKSNGMLLCGSDVNNNVVQPCFPDLSVSGVNESSIIGQAIKIVETDEPPTTRRIKSKELENILGRLYVGDNNQVVFNISGKEYPLYVTPKENSSLKVPIVVNSLPRGTKVY